MKHIVQLILLGILSFLALPVLAQSGPGLELTSVQVSPHTFKPGDTISVSAEVISPAGTEAGIAWYKVFRDQNSVAENYLGGGAELLSPLKSGERRVIRFSMTFSVPTTKYGALRIDVGAFAKPFEAQEKTLRYRLGVSCQSKGQPCFYIQQDESFPANYLDDLIRRYREILPCLLSRKGCILPLPPWPPRCPFCPDPVCLSCPTTWWFRGLTPDTQIRFLDWKQKEVAKGKWLNNAIQVDLKPKDFSKVVFIGLTFRGKPDKFLPLNQIDVYRNGSFVTSSSVRQ